METIAQNSYKVTAVLNDVTRCIDGCGVVTRSIEQHHVVPLCYGGKQNGRKVIICGNCHTEVHRCIENLAATPPPYLARIVAVGRRAKQLYENNMLEARDRRPSTVVDLDDVSMRYLAMCAHMFNTKSKSATIRAALKFAATHARKVA